MTIYFTNFFNWENQFGQIVSISNSEPDGYKYLPKLGIFVPEWSAVKQFKIDKNWDRYVTSYRELCRSRWPQIKIWLNGLDPAVSQTLCCWESEPTYCHRSLVAKIVEKHRPDCYRGIEVKNLHKRSYIGGKPGTYRLEIVPCPWGNGWCFRADFEGNYYQIGYHPKYPFLSKAYLAKDNAWLAGEKFLDGV